VAPDDVTPSVELDFSTSHGMFRIRRTPKHARRKRRGSGTTIENASGCLWRLVSPDAAAVGEPVATRLDEIGAEVLDIVGLSREQFVQTVVLPQGEFATFLHADAEHRRSLLQKLFGTEVYDRTVDRLVEQRRSAHQQRAAAATAVLGSVSAYCGAAGLPREEEESLIDRVGHDPDGALAAVQQQLDAIAAAASAAASAACEASERADRARAHDAELCRRQSARHRVLALRDELARLDADLEALERDTQRVALAGHAARLMPSILGLGEAQARATVADATVTSATEPLPEPHTPAGEWEARESACTSQAAAIESLLEVESGLARARRQLELRRHELGELTVHCGQLVAVIADGPAGVAALRSGLDEARQRAATLADVRREVESAGLRVRAARDLAAITADMDEARDDVAACARRARSAVKHETHLRVRFIDGMAGLLAGSLEPEHPCPVCGSTEHPEPARSAEAVDRADLDAAAETVAAATRGVESSRERLAALESAAAELRGVVGSCGIDDAMGELAAVEQRLAQAEAAEVQMVQLGHELAAAEQLLDEQRMLLGRAEKTRLALAASVAELETAIERDEARVADARGGHTSISERVAALKSAARHWRAALDALASAQAAGRDVQVRSTEVAAALASSPFADADEVEAAYLDDLEIAQLGEAIEARKAARARCEAELRSPELMAVDLAAVVDVDSSRQAVESAEALLAEAQERHGRLSQRLSEGQLRAAEVQSGLSAERAVFEATAATIRMADLASASTSDNAKSMTLPTFVLRERFADVVASANERLATMSDGRYRLEHVEDRRGNRRSGLDLLIRDAHSEQPRDPATLSGGESFYCSLALALGLADVVTAEAGGVDLGTLFVDEGFGSLDAGTLEQVLEVLQGLASSGRVVGIVSHVPELKEQVAERITVIPNRDGSSRLVVAA
jgi:exonuclease SbcC